MKRLFAATAILIALSLAIAACAVTPTATPRLPATPTSGPPLAAPTPIAAPATPTRAAAVAPTAVPPTPTAKGPAPTGKITIVSSTEPDTMEPGVSVVTAENMILYNVVDRLVERDAKTNQLKPALAESWEQVKPDTWRFKLRKGVKFQDGSPFNAETAAWNINRMNNPDHPDMRVQTRFVTLKQAVAVDESTLDLVSKEADPIMPLEAMWMPVESRKFIEENPELVPTRAVGTGPYKFTEWVRGQFIRITADPNYWGPPPAVKDVVFVWRKETSVRASMLKVGEVDIAWDISTEDVKQIKAPLKVSTEASNETCILRIDTTPGLKPKASLRDKRIRQAITFAMDKKAMVDNILSGSATIAAQPWPSFAVGYNPDKKPYPYDKEQAKKLVKDAGYNGEEMINYTTSRRYPKDLEVGEAIISMLKDVGLNFKLQPLEYSKWLTMHGGGKPDQEHPDMINVCASNELGDASQQRRYIETGGRGAFYSNPDVDALIKKAVALGGDERAKTFQKAWDIVYEDYYLLPLFYTSQMHATNDKINWKPRVDMFFKLDEVTWAK